MIASATNLETIAAASSSSAGGSVLLVGNFLSSSVGNRGVCEELADRLASSGWRVITTSSHPGRFLRLADMLRTVCLRRHEYEVAQIDVFSGPAFFWATAVSRMLQRLGKPFVLTLHGGNLPAFSRRWERSVRALLQAATAVTAPSGYLIEAMSKFRPDLRIVPNALDISAYPFRLRDAVEPRLVWLRAFHRIYEPTVAVRTVAILAPEFPNLQLTMIGPDKGDGSLQAARSLAQELGVYQRIRFQGRIPKAEVASWINQGDIFLNTSGVDNNPVSVLEAMACGACVVSSEVGGLPYLLKDGEDSLLVPRGNPAATADAVAQLLRRRDLAARLSLSARRKVEAFDWSTVLPMWHRLLRSAMS